MGNDGGSIPTRRELVKTAASATANSTTALKEKQREHLAHRWSQCPLSHTALQPPVVSDCAGNLYNKDAVLKFLLPAEVSGVEAGTRKEWEEFLGGRVKGLRDVVEVKFQVEKDEEERGKGEKWVCPVTGKELGVGTRAVYLVPCGHAFSKEAVREVGADGKKGECSVCGGAYERERDVLPILPSQEAEKEFVVQRMEALRVLGLSHSLKKDKTSKKRKNGAENGEAVKTNGEISEKAGKTASNGIKNSATASLTRKVLEEEEAKKKRKMNNENISSLYAKKGGMKERDGSFMTRGFSVK